MIRGPSTYLFRAVHCKSANDEYKFQKGTGTAAASTICPPEVAQYFKSNPSFYIVHRECMSPDEMAEFVMSIVRSMTLP